MSKEMNTYEIAYTTMLQKYITGEITEEKVYAAMIKCETIIHYVYDIVNNPVEEQDNGQ